MLHNYESFSASHGLQFNASKTQQIRFGCSLSCNCQTTIFFCGSRHHFVDTVTLLGHILSFDISDSPHIILKTHNMIKMANCLLYSFSGIDSVTLTRLFDSFCLSAIKNLSNSSLWTLEMRFNNILRKT